MLAENDILSVKIDELRKRQEGSQENQNSDDKMKRKRKTKEEVKRTYECIITDCGKGYGFVKQL